MNKCEEPLETFERSVQARCQRVTVNAKTQPSFQGNQAKGHVSLLSSEISSDWILQLSEQPLDLASHILCVCIHKTAGLIES